MKPIGANVLCFQLNANFPSWTSRVRSPSPALKISELQRPFTALPNNYPVKQKLVDQCRFQLRHSINPAFHRSLRVHVQIHIERMALLIGDDFRINIKFTHQRRVSSTHHLEIHPAKPKIRQFRCDVTPPHVIFRERRLQCFRREEPLLHPSFRRDLEPLG